MKQLDDFFAGLQVAIRTHEEERSLRALVESPDFSCFRYIEVTENRLSQIIGDLLDPRGAHGQGSLFLARFM